MQSYITVNLNSGSTKSDKRKAHLKLQYQSKSEIRREAIKSCIQKTIAFLFTQVGVLGLLVGYTIVGAIIFIEVESATESRRLNEVILIREDVARQLWSVTRKYNTIESERWRNEVEQIVKNFQNSLIREIRLGYDGSSDPIWTFPASLMFCLSVYTTIGYGNLVPKTETGKILTMFYSILGIPLLLLYMRIVGDLLATSARKFYSSVNRCKSSLERMKKSKHRMMVMTEMDKNKRKDIDNYNVSRSTNTNTNRNTNTNTNASTSQRGMGLDYPNIKTRTKEKPTRPASTSTSVRESVVEEEAFELELELELEKRENERGGEYNKKDLKTPVPANLDLEKKRERTKRESWTGDNANANDDDDDATEADDVMIPISTVFILFFCYILMGSVVFCWFEKWTFLDGIFFCFISLVTIGFGGDLVPANSPETRKNHLGVDNELIFCSIYILLGMAIMAMNFHLTQEKFFVMAKKLGEKLHLIS